LELKKDIAIINANRTSFTTEVIDQKNRAILANYISNNAFIELSNSKKATELYKNLFKDKKPVISIEYIDKDSYNDGRKITINASLIEQYLRIRGYNTDSLKNENVKKDVLAYISPLIVKEMASIYVSSKSNGYMPEVREKYAISLLYQAEYFKENYNRMNEIFSSFYGYNDYADKIDAINRIYRTSDSKYDFIQKVGIRYYSNLPSSNIARSEILNAVSKEIEKRAKLSVEDRKKIDKYAIFNEDDIKRLAPLEISAHVETFTTSALLKIQQILINKNNFASIYDKIISSF
ncbi:MAG: hypothetical protein N2446_00665, partial [Elusimicrobiales bacterium]|nr:hypothetical protein [Elusimicrobiales bacterium]